MGFVTFDGWSRYWLEDFSSIKQSDAPFVSVAGAADQLNEG